MKSVIAILVGTLALSSAASAQTRSVSHSLSPFNQISVSGEVGSSSFVVDIKQSASYAIDLVIDELIAEYVQAIVKKDVLYLGVDTKAIPSEVKKLYKARNAAPCVLRATIYTPDMTALQVADKSIVAVYDEFKTDSFAISMKDKSSLKELKINSKTVSVKLEDSANAAMTIAADDLDLNASNKTVLNMNADCVNLAVKLSNSAEFNVEGNYVDVKVESSNFSKAKFVGKGNSLVVNGSGNSAVDAINLKVASCETVLSNHSSLYEAASETLKLDLTGSSTVVFDGNPVIEIVKINSSTVTRYEAK